MEIECYYCIRSSLMRQCTDRHRTSSRPGVTVGVMTSYAPARPLQQELCHGHDATQLLRPLFFSPSIPPLAYSPMDKGPLTWVDHPYLAVNRRLSPSVRTRAWHIRRGRGQVTLSRVPRTPATPAKDAIHLFRDMCCDRCRRIPPPSLPSPKEHPVHSRAPAFL